MIFVPFVPPPPPSPLAQELGRRLRETVDLFRRDNPGLTAAEIRQAMQLSMQGLSRAGTRSALLIALGLSVVLLVGFMFLGGQVPLGGQTMILSAIIVIGILLVGLVFILKNR